MAKLTGKKGLGQFLEAQRSPGKHAAPETASSVERAQPLTSQARAGQPSASGAGAGSGSTTRRREKRRTKEGKEQLLVYLFPAGIKELKLIGVEEDRSTSDLVADAVDEWLQRRGRPPVA